MMEHGSIGSSKTWNQTSTKTKSKIQISTKHSMTPTVQNVRVGSSFNNFPVSFRNSAAPTRKTKSTITNPLASELDNFASPFLPLLAPIAHRPAEAITFRLHTQCRLATQLAGSP
jgi:hypothetical protein